ncbi:ComEC family protein [Dickeya lacustris]|uniref:ComEC family protein n=1 Tax=Dickeya lacustris TaxID=2259638 RepID=A0ABY8G7I7_9GAMM|nr:ComEC family protein [Dickeya lacustris]WFN55928.1 ComEC family protein [Dickeya lacustris]
MLLFLPELPNERALLWGVPLLWLIRTRFSAVGLMALSLCWSLYNGRVMMNQIDQLTQRPVVAQVRIESVRFNQAEASHAVVRLSKIDDEWVFPPIFARVTLPSMMQNWCGGQRWILRLSMRPVHSRLNEGGFDRQRWALAKAQPLTARVLSAEPVSSACGARQSLVTVVEQQTQTLPWHAIILALAVGEMERVDAPVLDVLRQTGTLHLMAISGLHIALAALFGFGVARAVQMLLPVHRIQHVFPLWCGWVLAWSYVWLAGGNPPAVRAALALSCWTVLRLCHVSVSSWQVWLWCLALVLVFDPLSVLSDSFWLSALAVASLIFWYQWVPLPVSMQRRKRWFWLRGLHVQLGMMLLLMPLQILLFQGISMSALPANLWAVPLVSLITTPLILIALLLMWAPGVAQGVWWLADRSLALVFAPLVTLPPGWLPLGQTLVSASVAGWAAVIIWRFGWWRTYPLSVLALILVMLLRPKPHAPSWRVDMLDIGHGLAIVIERNGKAWLYDTGPSWEGGESASREILPYLKWRGLQLQGVVISHSHLDHRGGWATLQAVYPQIPVYSSQYDATHRPCVTGESWRWQGLTFRVLWPPVRAVNAGNHDSCVIRVDDGRYSVLLTGDLEQEDEARLLKTQRHALAADILQVPHHGSNTSSSAPFLRAVGADWVMSSNSRYNPWRLPARRVTQRYRQMGIAWRDTAHSGQLSVRFFTDDIQILRYRGEISPRWYHRWFGAGEDNE